MKYTALRDWIKFKMKMARGYNYQPVMIITLLQNNGKATREKIEAGAKKEQPPSPSMENNRVSI